MKQPSAMSLDADELAPDRLVGSNVRPITDKEFAEYQRFIFAHAGIDLPPQKRHLVAGRLHKRLQFHQLRTYGEYFQYVQVPGHEAERQMLVDLLTTNETYFFREPQHFEYLREQFLPGFRGRTFRAWSAACSSGEEVYTLAMVLADTLGQGDWRIQGSDISERVLATARQALYPMERARGIPQDFLSRFCLKGVRSQAGTFMIDSRLRDRVEFSSVNLKTFRAPRPQFDLVFLRNVLIYFNADTKRDVVARIAASIRPGGLLLVSHVESLHNMAGELEMVRPSIFRRPAGGGR